MKKKIKKILVEEWFTESKGKVYIIWQFQDGTIWKRLTHYKKKPIVEIKWPKNFKAFDEIY